MLYSITHRNVNINGMSALLLTVGFGSPANNSEIVKEAAATLTSIGLTGGRLVLVNGPASLPVAMVLTHKLSHLYGAVACFDPKLSGYIVSISHDADFPIGEVLPASSVM